MNNTGIINLITQITQQRSLLEKTVSQALDLAHLRSDETEVTVTKTIGISINTRHGEIENIEFNNDGALSITVYRQYCKGSASFTNFSEQFIIHIVNTVLDITRYTSPDPYAGLPEKTLLAYESLDLDLFHPIELDVKKSVSIIAEAEKIALNSDKRIIHTEGSFDNHFSIRTFGNSHGMLQSYYSSRYSLYCSAIAESGSNMERDFAYTTSLSFNDLFSSKWVGEECAHRTLSHLNSRKLLTTKAPILFTAQVATSLFKHLVMAITGSNVYRKSTFLLNKLNKKILPDWLSIYEYPHLPKGLASSPFDGEGVITRNHIIVQNGILNTWLLDSYAARKLNLQSTGHSGGIYNWHVSYQEIDFIGLLKQMNRGLVITELMGQGVNIVNGDYSRGVSGFWVENGNIQYPVSEVTIAGNLHEMLYNIVSISNDIEIRSNIQCGSVLIEMMKIAGQ